MQRFNLFTVIQSATAVLLIAMMIPAGWAQDNANANANASAQVPSAPSSQVPAQRAVSSSQPFDVQEYAKPKSHFPNLLAPHRADRIEVNLHQARSRVL